MTEIVANRYNNHYRLEVDGHADEHDTCVMVSVLVQTLLVALWNNPNVHAVYPTLEDGHAVIEFLADDVTGEEDMRCILIGMIQLQKDHPEGINITQNIFDM